MMGMKGVAGAASEGGTADKKSRTAYAKTALWMRKAALRIRKKARQCCH
ncbi:MAG: hypothetical protein IT507_08485 [Burkholderiaceae bacterium]|nr:hypothetical protein [Burkholderiaceae bacterium]